MLSTNVLCLKKRKKRTYCISNNGTAGLDFKTKKTSGAVTMLQITEDTPPDMLAGAMDLTVHLPDGKSTKMSVERSTPMMDLLVQITTNNQLQLSGYTLQALSMAPSSDHHHDRILPFKPNTFIGALDTQHIKVVPKAKPMQVPKNVPPGHQPFESTFRLKVHLPRNQLYVTRVSQTVHLNDIMRKVCEEKNLDPIKYEFRHPGNLDETLDPKLTLSDYKITEIYLVSKGTASLNQAFSTSDIMALRKEEERKQMHNKTGGGVFNLIFRRTKPSTGSVSSENRSISPTQSDDSRSVTPPAIPPAIITPPQHEERPKPPQRKRRPAPKPPQDVVKSESPTNEASKNGLTICHSRNSSDSSGYHEASILSDNLNTSLPRRPKSTILNDDQSGSSSNLAKMSLHSKSTSSLAFPNRKKKTAPPPPPVSTFQEPSPVVASQPSIVAQESETQGKGQDKALINPVPAPRTRAKVHPAPRPRSIATFATIHHELELKSPTSEVPVDPKPHIEAVNFDVKVDPLEEPLGVSIEAINPLNVITEEVIKHSESAEPVHLGKEEHAVNETTDVEHSNQIIDIQSGTSVVEEGQGKDNSFIDTTVPKLDPDKSTDNEEQQNVVKSEKNEDELKTKQSVLSDLQKQAIVDIFKSDKFVSPVNDPPPFISAETIVKNTENLDMTEDREESFPEIPPPPETTDMTSDSSSKGQDKEQKQNVNDSQDQKNKAKPPEVVAVYPKPVKDRYSNKSMFDSYTRKRGFQIGTSLLEQNSDDDNISQASIRTAESVTSALNAFQFVDEIEDVDVEMFNGKRENPTKSTPLNQLHGMHELEKLQKNDSSSSLRSTASLPGFLGISSMKKWNDIDGLDKISLNSNGDRNAWVIGDPSDSDSNITPLTPMDSLRSFPSVESKEEAIKANAIENLQTWSSPEPAVEPQKTVELQNGAKLQKTAVLQSAAELDKAEEPQKIEELHEAAEPKQTVEPPKAVELHRPAEPQEETKANVEVESDWHYQLPSPPKAFRDSSPEPGEIDTTIPTDSVVTSPELFEKLKEVSVSEVEKQSDISEEEKPSILNTLSLENLEKRKSLVYNRELATSLKLAEEEDTFHSSVKKFERTYEEVRRSSLKETPAPAPVKSTLPNFKITTYDNPKQKINIFEDDTIRSSETGTKRNAPSNLLRSYVGRSMENINFNDFKKPYKPQVLPAKTFTSVSRSESFSDQGWSPSKPVTRSKSQLTINKYQDNKSVTQLNGDNLTKSNSLYDVSGLQSLEVMRLIQNKLNTPTSSVEELDGKKFENIPEKLPEAKKIEKKTSSYQYRTPSINMGTWSERPKIPVNVKEDPDYKHSSNSTKLIVNTTSNNLRSYNSIEVINKSEPVTFNHRAEKNVSVQVNNSEPISGQNTGNVVIKIGGYRKPLGNVNKNERPHSMTFGNEFDISRVPIVRSVELKKPYKEINTSVTQIYQNNESSPVLRPQIYQNHESSPVLRPQFGPKPFQKANTLNRISYGGEAEQKPIFRANSFVQNASPVVRGFRINTDHTKSWQQPQKDFGSNKSVPFSQSQLKRTESKKNELNQQPPPPPPAPPVLAKSFTVGGNKDNRNSCSADPKEQLLQAIRDFGGKKGLRAVKV